MESIIGLVLGSVGEYVNCHRNFQNDVDDLRKRVVDLKRRRNDKLEEIRTTVDLEKQVKEEVQGWLEDTRKVIEIEMPDIEEEVHNVSYLSQGNLGRRVRQKIQEVREIYDLGSFLGGLVIDRPPPIGVTLPTENMMGEVDVKEAIWRHLMSHEVGMIGVCGIGGVGKTTVMKHIHNKLVNEANRFTKVIWVTVSHPLDVKRLQGDIAKRLQGDIARKMRRTRRMQKSLLKGGDELNRASRLMQRMKTEKYALILDDVWDTFTLQRVGIPEPTVDNGCKIVITSRSVDVCNRLRCQIVRVPPLLEQESLNLFLDKVGREVLQIPHLEEILKLMVKECAGLPLAIVVIASSMRGVEDISEWRNALRELCQCVVNTERDSEDEIFNRLKFSYDRLPNSSIRNCFLYCSLYPEDKEIKRIDLIENWICEGFIEKLGSRRERQDKGHVILNRLENNCLLEKGQGNEFVKMHDVVRDMALRIKSVGPGRFMVKAGMGLTNIPDEDEWTEDLGKASLMHNKISYIPENMSPKCLMLSTLILKENRSLRKIPECFFANIPLLKFLDLSSTDIEALPNSMGNLEHLTTLILYECRSLKSMPSLSKLKALKKLNLDKAGLYVAPEGLEMLENLEFLDLSCPELTKLPGGIVSKLFHLQCLRKRLIFSNDIRGEEVAKLEMLKYFEGGFNELKDFNSFVSKLKHFRTPTCYRIEVRARNSDYEGYFRKFNYIDHKGVALLGAHIWGKDGLVLPDDLRDLTMEHCKTVGDISLFLKNLTQLERCELVGCVGIECVVSLSSSSSSSFTLMNNLEHLHLGTLPCLRDVVKAEKITASLAQTVSPHFFPNLKQLIVENCAKLNKLFPCELLQSRGLQNLERIRVTDCPEMVEIIGCEEEDEGNQTITPILITLPKLQTLELNFLPKLKRIYTERGVMVCDSLNSIAINYCPRLKKIPLCLGRGNGQPSLPAIKVYIENPERWWESMKWENSEDKNVFQPFLKYCYPNQVVISYWSAGL